MQQNASQQFDLCILGSANSDLFLKVKDFPKEGETINAIDSYIKNGGKGANQAVASARLGSRTVFAGQMGQDSLADLLIKEMKESNVFLDGLLINSNIQTGQALILLNERGENCIVIIGGANMFYQQMSLPQQYINALQQSQFLQLQMEVPQSINILAAKYMNQAQKFSMLDCGGRNDLIEKELLDNLTFISPNETELERLINQKIDDRSEDFQKKLTSIVREQVLNKYPHLYVLLKLGAQGSLMVTKDIDLFVQSAPHYNQQILQDFTIIDTVGAGDCFTSGFCSSFYNQCKEKNINTPYRMKNFIIKNQNESEFQQIQLSDQCNIFKIAMKFGSASAFLSITKEGAMPSMPKLDEVNNFVDKYFHHK